MEAHRVTPEISVTRLYAAPRREDRRGKTTHSRDALQNF